jgi:pyroglutamyl-peptidase
MARILVTGFEPFARWVVNSSWEAARTLAAGRRDVRALCLPVDHAGAAREIREALAREGPEAVLLAGLAPDPVLRLETVARPGPLAPHGGGVRLGRWRWGEATRAMAAAGLPARLSAAAGGYVCDTTYWAALGEGAVAVAFLHLPPPGPVWTPARGARAMAACLAGAGRARRA